MRSSYRTTTLKLLVKRECDGGGHENKKGSQIARRGVRRSVFLRSGLGCPGQREQREVLGQYGWHGVGRELQ